MKFKYKNFGSGILRPIIPVHFAVGSNERQIAVLVDSGADKTLLHAEIGELLGLKVESGERGDVAGITGLSKPTFLHNVDIIVGGHRFSTTATFTHGLGPNVPAIVGQQGFFNLFTVKFDLIKEEVEIKTRDKRKHS